MSIERLKGSFILLAILAITLIVAIYVYRKKDEHSVNNSFNDYDGDEYEGTMNYMGDKNAPESFIGKYPGYVKKSTLFKVVQQSNLLKHERAPNGQLTMIQTGRFLKKGAQIRIFNDSLSNPIQHHGGSFVMTNNHFFVRLNKLKMV
jgi:hypothetical protein